MPGRLAASRGKIRAASRAVHYSLQRLFEHPDQGVVVDALVRMFEQALKTVMALPETRRESFLDRLQDVRASGQGMGWGVEYAFDDLWQRAGLEFDS